MIIDLVAQMRCLQRRQAQFRQLQQQNLERLPVVMEQGVKTPLLTLSRLVMTNQRLKQRYKVHLNPH